MLRVTIPSLSSPSVPSFRLCLFATFVQAQTHMVGGVVVADLSGTPPTLLGLLGSTLPL
jgi:hypothetical protein